MNFDQSFCDVDPAVEWPETAEDFERRIVRESFCEGLDELARRILYGMPRLSVLRKLRAYAPRVIAQLGRESAESMIEARVGPATASFFARCVLPPEGPVHAIVCLADGAAPELPPSDLEELRRFRDLLALPKDMPREDRYALIYGSDEDALAERPREAYDWSRSTTP